MSNRALYSRCLLLVLLLLSGPLAQGAQDSAPLRVGVAPCPPFVLQEQGGPGGLALYLWDRVAEAMGMAYQVQEFTLNEMLAAVSQARETRVVDVGISCLSITAEREKYIDFSHSFYETYIGVAARQQSTLETAWQILTSPSTLKAAGVFFGLAALVGLIFYLLERKSNAKLYTMETGRGKFVEAFLVGAVFITRGPINFWEFRTLTARILATALAVASTFLIAGITAMLASLFTMENLRSQIKGLGDLARARVGTLELSTSARFLEQNGIAHQASTDLQEMMLALERGQLDAVVFDEAYLRYEIKRGREQGRFHTVSVLPLEFDEQNYGFALGPDSPLLEPLNQALLDVRRTAEWRTRLKEYLGE